MNDPTTPDEEMRALEEADRRARAAYATAQAEHAARETESLRAARAREGLPADMLERPATPVPPRAGAAIAAWLPAEPVWKTCACGAKTGVAPCWDCKLLAEAKARAEDRKRLALKSIPPHYRDARLDAPWLAAKVLSVGEIGLVAAKILAAPRVLLVGPATAGKTSLLVACMYERLADALFVAAVDLGEARAEHKLGHGMAGAVAEAIAAPILVLDDLGKDEPHKLNPIPRVIDARFRLDRPTWCTTGLKKHELVEQYDDGIARRISEDGLTITLGRAAR